MKNENIVIGDIVKYADETKGIVLDINFQGNLAIYTENGCIENWIEPGYVKYIGKSVDIFHILHNLIMQ